MALFYVLYSQHLDRYYIGATRGAMSERLSRHNCHHKKGFTGKSNDWVVVYTETYSNGEEAFARERAVKMWKSRKRLVELVQSTPS